MQDIHAQEEAIQHEWLAMAEALGDAGEMVTDGLLFRGQISYIDGYWSREKGGEERQWAEADRRLLILTKDLNDEEGWDIRQETGRMHEVAFSYDRAIPFYKNLRMWSYLLLNATADSYPSFREARRMERVGPFYETAPIARVNCKKQVGGSSISDATLMRYLETYAEPLRRQINLYQANIILCAGCSGDRNRILDFVRSQCIPDLAPIADTGDWIYYSPSTAVMAVNSYHPSARVGYEDTYLNLANALMRGLAHIKRLC
ncbi:MAG: hypothetical protein LUC85_00725 [Bacteroidales bacterium]|nr:hypothetical protein [Bacteroidales bacterium]MCD8393343.1 hypothetical protein [Bacteroidales bacterium]